MTLKDKATLESLVQKTWMYKGSNYTINDFTHIGDRVILSTDIKALTISVDKISDFAKDLLPVSLPAPKGTELRIDGVDAGFFSELAAGLMTSFREIQGANDERFLKEAGGRARNKVMISKAVTDIAKTVIAAKKASKS